MLGKGILHQFQFIEFCASKSPIGTDLCALLEIPLQSDPLHPFS